MGAAQLPGQGNLVYRLLALEQANASGKTYLVLLSVKVLRLENSANPEDGVTID